MKWLLIFVWVSGGQVEIATERFDTEAECEVAGAILTDLLPLPSADQKWSVCYQIKGD